MKQHDEPAFPGESDESPAVAIFAAASNQHPVVSSPAKGETKQATTAKVEAAPVDDDVPF